MIDIDREGFPGRLKQARAYRGISQREAGKLAGVGERTWSDWERGLSVAGVRNMLGAATALGVTVEWLRAGTESVYEIAERNGTVMFMASKWPPEKPLPLGGGDYGEADLEWRESIEARLDAIEQTLKRFARAFRAEA